MEKLQSSMISRRTLLKEPVTVRNMDGLPVTINQMGWRAIYLGEIDCFFECSRKRTIKPRMYTVK